MNTFGTRFNIRLKAGLVRKERHIVPALNPSEAFEQFSDELAEIYFLKRLFAYSREKNLISREVENKLLDLLAKTHQNEAADFWCRFVDQISKKYDSIVSEQIKWAISSAQLKADARFAQIKEKSQRHILTCEFPGCGRVYLAKRSHSHFCDVHRKIGNVYKSRGSHPKKSLPLKKCEYVGCGKEFLPITKQARFHSDVCRVRAGREKRRLL